MLSFKIAASRVVYQLWFSPNGQQLAVRASQDLELFDPTSGTHLATATPSGPFCGFWGGIDRQRLYLHQQGIGLVRIGEAKLTSRPLLGSLDFAHAIFSRSGVRAVRQNRTEQGVSLIGYEVGTDRVSEARAWPLHLFTEDAAPAPVEFHPDGERFLVWVYSRMKPSRLQLWAWEKCEAQAERLFPSALSLFTALSYDGRWFARGDGRSGNLWVCDITDFTRSLQEVKPPKQRQITAATFHPSGRYLAITHKDSVSYCDTATWKVAKTFDWKIGKLRCVAFSPDGALAAVGSDKGQVVVWDVDV